MSYGLVEDREAPAAPASVAHPPSVVRGIYGTTPRGFTGFFKNGVSALVLPAYDAFDQEDGKLDFYTQVGHTFYRVYAKPDYRETIPASEVPSALERQLSLETGALGGLLETSGSALAEANGSVDSVMVGIRRGWEPKQEDLARIDAAGWTYFSTS